MDDAPLVSVVVPAYNAERYIRDCVLSILDQGDIPLEVLVVDDGSSDRTAEIVQAIGDPVRCLHQANAGSAVARNHGIHASRGDYIAFCDSDDLWAPCRLRQQVDFLQANPEYQAACGRFLAVDADFTCDQMPPQDFDGPAHLDDSLSGWMYLTLLRDSVFHLDALLMTRGVAQRISFDPGYRRGQDFDFFLQLAQTTRIAQIDGIYAFYRQHPDSITRRPHLRNYRAEITQAAIARYGHADPEGRSIAHREVDQLLANSWFSHGWDLYHAGWYGKAGEAFKRCLKLQPMHRSAALYTLRCLWRRRRDRMPPDARPL